MAAWLEDDVCLMPEGFFAGMEQMTERERSLHQRLLRGMGFDNDEDEQQAWQGVNSFMLDVCRSAFCSLISLRCAEWLKVDLGRLLRLPTGDTRPTGAEPCCFRMFNEAVERLPEPVHQALLKSMARSFPAFSERKQLARGWTVGDSCIQVHVRWRADGSGGQRAHNTVVQCHGSIRPQTRCWQDSANRAHRLATAGEHCSISTRA